MKDTFTKLESELLARTDLNLGEKVIIAYINSFQSNNKYCFEEQKTIAVKIGVSIRTLEGILSSLKKKGLIFTSTKKEYFNRNKFQNRKAIIAVDENNPLPTSSTSEAKASEAKQIKNNTSTKKEIEKTFTIEEKCISLPQVVESTFTEGAAPAIKNEIEDMDNVKLIEVNENETLHMQDVIIQKKIVILDEIFEYKELLKQDPTNTMIQNFLKAAQAKLERHIDTYENF